MNHVDVGEAFEFACWHAMSFIIHRYLMSNADGRWNGAEKAQRHDELCKFYVAVMFGVWDHNEVRMEYEEHWKIVHDATSKLTDNLDTQIGFPLKGRPDYDELARSFFRRFHNLAMESLLGEG